MTLNLGVRWERFETKNAAGDSFMAIKDQHAPRLGAIWDVAGNGRSKVYGSLGIYHLPMSSTPAYGLAASSYLDETWHTLIGGINPDGSPGSDLLSRTYHGMDLYNAGLAPVVICAGGAGGVRGTLTAVATIS